jgi:hypothetical protein
MAGTIVTGGSISTEEVLTDERKLDVDDRIRKLRPDESQFSTMTDKTPSRTAVREKVNWFEEDDFPRQVSAASGIATGVTALPLVAGQGKIVAARDLLRNMRTGEGLTVVSVATDTVTVTRQTGNIAQAAVNAGDVFLVVGDAQAQGSDFPAPRYLARVLGYNYTQITRTTWSFTGTQTSIDMYGGREPAKEAIRKAREHKRKWEAIGFFGMRSFQAAVAPDNDPQGTAGGAIEFITSNVVNANAVAFTDKFFDAWVMSTLPYGDPNSKVLFASPVVVQNLSSWVRTGMGSQFAPSPMNVYGVQVDSFISGAYGYKLPIVLKSEWAEFPVANGGYGGYAFLLDMSLISQVPLRDRDTKLITEQQPKGKDVYSAEYFREATYEFALEKAHGILKGAVSP